MHRAGWVVFMVAVAGCGGCAPATVSSGFEAELTEQSGCGDVFLYAHDPEDTVVLSVRSGQVLDEVVDDETLVIERSLPDADFVVAVDVGTYVSGNFCSDVIVRETRVETRYTARSGTVRLTITPAATESALPHARVELIDVELANARDESVTVESMSFEANVGWYAG